MSFRDYMYMQMSNMNHNKNVKSQVIDPALLVLSYGEASTYTLFISETPEWLNCWEAELHFKWIEIISRL